MQRRSIGYLLIWLLFNPTLQSQDVAGINFIDNQYEKALAEAKAEGKAIFIDAYTTWCGPCKMMDSQVFADSAVGQYYNTNFVNLKLDMEKGTGLEVAAKFDVRAYPSFLFVDADQNLLHRGVGFQPVENFLQLGAHATDPSRQLGSLARKYKRGDRSESLLYDYAMALLKAGDDKALQVGKDYLEEQQNWATANNMALVYRMVRDYEDDYFDFIVKKKHLFFKEFGESRTNALLLNIMQKHFYSQIDQIDLQDVKKQFNSTFTKTKAAPFYDLFEVQYYDMKGDMTAYKNAARSYIKKYPNLNWSTLNQISWNFYEKIDDPKALGWAKKWAKKSISLNSNHFNNDTLAAIYYKLGKKKPALKYAHRAIDLAKEAGAPFEETRELVERIESM